MYPYLKEKTKEQLPEDERKDIFRNIKAMLMHKIKTTGISNRYCFPKASSTNGFKSSYKQIAAAP